MEHLTDKTTGEVVESYTMLTLNADIHPLMNHAQAGRSRARPTGQAVRGAHRIEDVDAWLNGSLRPPRWSGSRPQVFDAGPSRHDSWPHAAAVKALSEGGHLMADTERLEAKGPRGEACIIIRTWAARGAANWRYGK